MCDVNLFFCWRGDDVEDFIGYVDYFFDVDVFGEFFYWILC